MKTPRLELFKYLRKAMDAEGTGIKLEFLTEDDAKVYRQRLYAARRDIGGFEELSFLLDKNFLLIVKARRHAEERQD